jgi:hypothetical protein
MGALASRYSHGAGAPKGRSRGRAAPSCGAQLVCARAADEETAIETGSAGFNDPTGDNLLRTVQLPMKVAALAVACGLTRSVVIQVGNGNGGDLRFIDPDSGQLMDNNHDISHRPAPTTRVAL